MLPEADQGFVAGRIGVLSGLHVSVTHPHVPKAIGTEAAVVMGVQVVVVCKHDVRAVCPTTGFARVIALDLHFIGVGHAHPSSHQPGLRQQSGSNNPPHADLSIMPVGYEGGLYRSGWAPGPEIAVLNER